MSETNDDNSKIDLGKAVEGLKKESLYIVIEQVVRQQMDKGGYRHLEKLATLHTEKVLEHARKLSSLRGAGALINADDVAAGMFTEAIRRPHKTPRQILRELGMGVALVPIGLLVGAYIHRGEVSHTSELVIAVVLELIAVFAVAFGQW